jgi:hypothetical protein
VTNVALALAGNLGAEPATRSPSWLGYAAGGLIVLAIACETIYIWWVLGRGGDGGRNPSDDDGGGGTGPGPDRISPRGSPGTDPEWWPEFERQFADHIGAQARVQADALSRRPRRDPRV